MSILHKIHNRVGPVVGIAKLLTQIRQSIKRLSNDDHILVWISIIMSGGITCGRKSRYISLHLNLITCRHICGRVKLIIQTNESAPRTSFSAVTNLVLLLSYQAIHAGALYRHEQHQYYVVRLVGFIFQGRQSVLHSGGR